MMCEMSNCKLGCIYRSKDRTLPCCDYCFATGHPRGCEAGPDCIRYAAKGVKMQRKDLAPFVTPAKKKQARARLTPEERREHRLELRRKEYAQKKAARLLEQSRAAEQNTLSE